MKDTYKKCAVLLLDEERTENMPGMITDCLIFQNSFKLGAKIMLEA